MLIHWFPHRRCQPPSTLHTIWDGNDDNDDDDDNNNNNHAVHSNLTHSDRLKFKTIIIADVHARDVVDLFVEHHINDARQFQWLSRLRFHWLKEVDNISIEHYSGTLPILL